MTATVCVDAGTTVVKAVVFDDAGSETVVVRRSTSLLAPRPGWSEQDMDTVLDAVCGCLAEAAGRSAEPIGRVAVTAQGDGAWLVDGAGRPVRPAVLWNDARAREIVDGWAADGRLEQAFRTNGSLGNLGLPHAVLAWFAAHDPAVLAATASVLTCGSWLYGSLTRTWGLHRSEASAPWLDARSGQPSEELLRLYGLEAWRAVVPTVLSEDELTRPLTQEIAARTGLPPGTPVTLAPYDVVATAVGGGSTAPGDGFCILGTTVCVGSVVDGPDTSGVPSGLTLLAAAGQPVVRAFPTLAGIGALTWMAGLLGHRDVHGLLALAAGSTPGSGGVRTWPYLSPAGERAPFLDPSACGVIGGLALTSTPADLARSVLEGLAHVIRDCLDAVGRPTHVLRTSGGGSGSDLWCQVIADVTGVPVARSAGTQTGAKGALLYASVAAGRYPDLAAAVAGLVTAPDVFTPDPAVRDLYDRRHAEFLDTRHALAGQWRTWGGRP